MSGREGGEGREQRVRLYERMIGGWGEGVGRKRAWRKEEIKE